jgi:GlpG protein
MRLIGHFKNEKEAYQFYSFLTKEGIQNTYETFKDPVSQTIEYRIWIYDEDDLDPASEWFQKYLKEPENPVFQSPQPIFVSPTPKTREAPSSQEIPLSQKWKILVDHEKKEKRKSFTLNHFLLSLCILLFLWNDLQEARILKDKGLFALQVGLTPLMRHLMFDYPCSFRILDSLVNIYPLKDAKEIKDLPKDVQQKFEEAQQYPSWKGFYDMTLHWKETGWAYFRSVPLFEKIKEGEIWRLFTPCVLHRDFLHALFNLAWLWVLGRQMEDRIGKWRFAVFILIVGIISNIAQYLAGGPYFLGLSGVIVGMVGFIWMRQRLAPWEGYPLHKGTILFLFLFVVAMLGLEVIAFFLEFFSATHFSANIANTAHIFGGLTGMLLARIPLFSRGEIP